MIEVPRPAGCEPLNPLSGWDAELIAADAAEKKSGRPLYREEHDTKSVFFIDRLSQGKWELRFSLRAHLPGDFRALPAVGEAMYVPEIRANTDARRIKILSSEKH
jgi:uncharacterized protein YfaS (alpha-2-macroglobulin family)